MFLTLESCQFNLSETLAPFIITISGSFDSSECPFKFSFSPFCVDCKPPTTLHDKVFLPESLLRSHDNLEITFNLSIAYCDSCCSFGSLSLTIMDNGSICDGHHVLTLNNHNQHNPHLLLPLDTSASESAYDSYFIMIVSVPKASLFNSSTYLHQSHQGSSFSHSLSTPSSALSALSDLFMHAKLDQTEDQGSGHRDELLSLLSDQDYKMMLFQHDEEKNDLIWKCRYSKILGSFHLGLPLLFSSFDWNDQWQFDEFLRILSTFEVWKTPSIEAIIHSLGIVSNFFHWNTVDSKTPRHHTSSLFTSELPFHFSRFSEFFNYLTDRLYIALNDPNVPKSSPFFNSKVIVSLIFFLVPLSFYFSSEDSNSIVDTLIDYSSRSFEIMTQLFWLLRSEEKRLVEANISNELVTFYRKVRRSLIKKLKSTQVEHLFKQKDLVMWIRNVAQNAKSSSKVKDVTEPSTPGSFHEQVSQLAQKVRNLTQSSSSPTSSLSLPFLRKTTITGVGDVKVFSSAMKPVFVSFISKSKSGLIYKIGDDLRNDYFSLSLMQLMDEILLDAGAYLTSPLVKYDVIPTGLNEGLIEAIPDVSSMSAIDNLEEILKDSDELMANFIESLAVNVIMTFIIGVGDRHLDNILFQYHSGKVIHIDFGFICDLDPKFFQPAVRIVSSWVNVMGDRFQEFQDKCCSYYSILRKNMSSILSFIKCSINSQLQSFEVVGRKHILDTIVKKFAVEKTAEESYALIRDQIESAYRSVFAKLNETAHRLATAGK
ncbi:hypothetical protein P9112_011380 [Eukaryota sp. TZLM1-RC]